ncbi:MAG TPA: carboxypeptidase regulatory-like domain-containing protein [Vicinamibacterales bacterium]|nr:carboxypeptidase regulatory-like domain-containing protein [Vicinamibacterales bacterium]
MRTIIKTLLLLAVVVILPRAVWAQVTLAGTVKDASGAVLPGVTVEASSPALIEKTRTATTDSTGLYRIESLQPGTYSVTFTLAGFSTLKRDDVVLSGTGVVQINADLKIGGVSETIVVTGETPVVDVQSTKTAVTLDNETMRSLPAVRSYSYVLTAVPGIQSNITDVNTGPVFAIFPVHGGRGVESRLTVEGMNISNPPGGNQPPNYTADIGNSAEVTVQTAGGLGEFETAGVQMNIVPKQGGNNLSGLFAASGFSGGMQSDNYSSDLQSRGAGTPNPTFHVYDVNGAVGGPIKRDKLWFYMSVREQGTRRNILNVYHNLSAGDPTKWNYAPDFSNPGLYDRQYENYTPRITWQASPKNKFSFSWDEQPVCRTCSGTASFSGSPSSTTAPEADGHGEFSPQRVQTARWTNPLTGRLLLEAGLGNTFYQWGDRELDPNPTENLIRVTDTAAVINPQGTIGSMTYRSQNWLINKTDGANWFFNGSYVTGSHSMKFGYQGNWWRDDREVHANTQSLAYTFARGVPTGITEYANPYFFNARAAMTSFFAQDQWTINRLTLQGAIRYDHPWSWFPEVTQPANAFFPGVTFARADGVTGYNDITPRFGAAYDVFGNGKTALKAAVGKYLQGASVGNLVSGANPSMRIPGANLTFGFNNPSVTRSWTTTRTPAGADFLPNCNLQNPNPNSTATDSCGVISSTAFGSSSLIGANYDPGVLSGWGVRPSDWSYSVSVQQQLIPKASVEVGYYRRTFTQYTTGGTVTDNLAVGPSDLTPFFLTAPTDSRLPGGGGYQIGPLYNLTPAASLLPQNLLIKSTKDVGDDTRVFNGVDVNFNVRNVKGFTFSGGTSTGKVVNDWCAIRAVVPESFALNPYCHVESPFQTSFNGLASYIVPKIDVLISGVYRDRPVLNGTPNNASTDQLGGSMAANLTFFSTDATGQKIAQQIGRNLTGALFTVNMLTPGVMYGGGDVYGSRNRSLDISLKKIIRMGRNRLTAGLDIYNVANADTTLFYNTAYTPTANNGWLTTLAYLNPRVFRIAGEFSF